MRDPIEVWQGYVESLAWAKGHCDESCHRAFLRAGSLGLDPQTAFCAVVERVRSADVRLRLPKLESQLRRAYGYAGTSPNVERCGKISIPLTWPSRDHQLIARIAYTGFGLVDLSEASPVRFDDDQSHTEAVIDTLFPGNPLLCVGMSNCRFDTRPREAWRGSLDQCQFIVSSPMTALFGHTTEGKLSAHSLENTGSRRFLVIEFDSGATDEQAALLDHLARIGPLVLAVHSGNRSLHGWFYCAGVDDSVLRRFMEHAVRLGADLATYRNKSQFVRMPDGCRENGNRQSVFYFNPEVLP